ncbi:MAG TPA: hypothetical protein VGG71_10755 [Chitinophagaceae bacterium]
MNSKFFVGGIVGGIVYLLLGWVIYGMLLKGFMTSNGATMKSNSDMVWWALIVGNFAFGFLLAYVIGKGSASAGSGAGVGFVLGLLVPLGMDLIGYATSTTAVSLKLIAADVAASVVLSAITGVVVGAVMGMSKKAVASA